MSIFTHWIRSAVRKKVPEIVSKVLHEKMPGIVDNAMRESFSEKPDRPLNELGFRWAWVLRIRHHWPDVQNYEAARWLDDYLPSTFGDPQYNWTARAAQELADEYVMEFGE